MSHSGTTRQRASCASTRTRAASPATFTPTARSGRDRWCQSRSASVPISLFGVTPSVCHPCGPASPHFIRLLPTSRARMRLTREGCATRRRRSTGAVRRQADSLPRVCRAHQARRSEISPERKRARRGPSASTSAPLASTPATLPVTAAPSGSSSSNRLALVRVPVLPLRGKGREALLRVLLQHSGELGERPPPARDCGRRSSSCAPQPWRGRSPGRQCRHARPSAAAR